MQNYDVIVVGAGLIGAACADALTRRGLRVLVLERGMAGGGTTAAGMGHLVVMDSPPAEFALTAYSLEVWREIVPHLPEDGEDDPCGTLWVAEDEDEMAHAKGQARSFATRAVRAELLDARGLSQLEPSLRTGFVGGLFLPDDRVIYPPAVTRFFLQRAIRHGAQVRERVEVRSIESTRPGCMAVHTATGRIGAGQVVNAAGAFAPALTPGLPIEPRKGHLVITDRYPGLVRHQMVELGYVKSAHAGSGASVAMNIQPRRTGQILIGSSREYVGWDSSINREVRGRMLARAAHYVPALRELSAIRTWIGFRPSTADKLPLIGEWEPGLTIAAGHEGLGITTASGTAALIADLLTGATPAIDPVPYHPRREMPHDA